MSRPVAQPTWRLTYLGKDITRDVTPYVESVVYSDVEHGESDEIEVRLNDSEHKWKNAWYPGKGDKVDLQLGYAGAPLLPCGKFEVDEIGLESPPDVVALRGLASRITDALREDNSRGYENQTLRDIANSIAGKHGLKVEGTIKAIRIRRITQKQEKDLGFLRRLAEEYGYVFSVRDNRLTFHDWDTLSSVPPVMKLDRKQMTRLELRDKTSHIYKACQVRYHDPQTRQLMQFDVKAEDIETETESRGSGVATPVDDPKPNDVLKITVRCENEEQAEAKGLAALRRKNGIETSGRITCFGDPRLVSGNAIEITGLGRLSAVYQIVASRHSIDRQAGYATEIEVRRRV